jgi:hypothetical protein
MVILVNTERLPHQRGTLPSTRDITMKTFIHIFAAAAALVSISAGAQAGVGKTRGDCYNHVISACNKKANTGAAHACANSGMDACDKQFPQKAGATPIPQGTLSAMRSRVLSEVTRPDRPSRSANTQ